MSLETDWVPATFTDDEFERLLGETALDQFGRFELRRGVLTRMNAQFAPHMQVKSLLYLALVSAIQRAGADLAAGVEGTVRFGDAFQPLPDLIVWSPFTGRKAIPGAHVQLIVEVSDSTLGDDLGDKRDDYARAGLPEYWVADVNARVVHLFADPVDGAFRRAGLAAFGDPVEALTLPGLIVETAGLP